MKDSAERLTLLRQGKRVFRASHKQTGAFWEGTAATPEEFILRLEENDWHAGDFELRELTPNGGWAKPKMGEGK